MNPRLQAAWEIHKFLTKHKIPYAIIGGTALPRWGEPRFTKDVDLTVVTSLEEGVAPFVRLVLTRFESREPDALAFARQNRVLKLRASNQCDIDISLGLPGYEMEMLERAVDYDLEKGKAVRVCSAEDLIILKSVAGRPQDLIDIQGVILRQRAKLDAVYIRKWLKQFDEALPAPRALQDFEKLWRAEKRALRETRALYRIKSKRR
jgi:hypothetical protein